MTTYKHVLVIETSTQVPTDAMTELYTRIEDTISAYIIGDVLTCSHINQSHGPLIVPNALPNGDSSKTME